MPRYLIQNPQGLILRLLWFLPERHIVLRLRLLVADHLLQQVAQQSVPYVAPRFIPRLDRIQQAKVPEVPPRGPALEPRDVGFPDSKP